MLIDGLRRKSNVVGSEAHEADKERVGYLRVPPVNSVSIGLGSMVCSSRRG